MDSVIRGLALDRYLHSGFRGKCSKCSTSNSAAPPPAPVPFAVRKRPLDLPFGVVARFLLPLPLHLPPRPQEY